MTKKFVKAIKTRDFWVEYISLYVSIIIATLIVQMALLKMEISIIIFCLIKSLLVTVPNIIAIMYGRRITIVINHWFMEVIVYVLCSIPYMEITLIYLYKQDIKLTWNMITDYATVYFVMGFFIKWYLGLSKRLINKIFDGELF
ncbi:MAG: hypothetical protein WCJ45_02670 [bacterium]